MNIAHLFMKPRFLCNFSPPPPPLSLLRDLNMKSNLFRPIRTRLNDLNTFILYLFTLPYNQIYPISHAMRKNNLGIRKMSSGKT